MPTLLQCDCGKKLNAPDALAGRAIKCPHCGAAQVVPLAEPAGFADGLDDAPVDTRPVLRPIDEPDTSRPDARRVALLTRICVAVVALLVIGGISWAVWWYNRPTQLPPVAAGEGDGYFDQLVKARNKGRAVVASHNMNQLLLAIRTYHLNHGEYPRSMADLLRSNPALQKVMTNPSTKQNPGYIYAPPPPNAGPTTPVLYEALNGAIDPDGAVGHLGGQITLPKILDGKGASGVVQPGGTLPVVPLPQRPKTGP